MKGGMWPWQTLPIGPQTNSDSLLTHTAGGSPVSLPPSSPAGQSAGAAHLY